MSKNKSTRKHVSPGVYTSETDITYAAKSLGITSLGVAGETLKGPAFEPVLIEDWNEFQDYFGGVSPEKFKGSDYPKYELPYIAKSYLSESNQLYVSRVLGLSGYNAGNAWLITGSKKNDPSGTKYVIAILRSRGHYDKNKNVSTDDCSPNYKYDNLTFDLGALALSKYQTVSTIINNCQNSSGTTSDGNFDVNTNDYGKFIIQGLLRGQLLSPFKYPVSLNYGAKDYITTVLGTKPEDGNAPLYVEELYDVALEQAIYNGEIDQIDSTLTEFYGKSILPIGEPVLDLLHITSSELKSNNLGQRFLCSESVDSATTYAYAIDDKGKIVDKEYKSGTTLGYTSGLTSENSIALKIGYIYTVRSYSDSGKTKYVYTFPTQSGGTEGEEVSGKSECIVTSGRSSNGSGSTTGQIFVKSYNQYFGLVVNGSSESVAPISCDLNDYKESYREAITPWFVSEIKGDGTKLDVKKLFRFHTISDGDAANSQIKVSIENVRPDDGTFDVLIRDYNDIDANTIILEKYTKCNMTIGDTNYIGYKIGTYDGDMVSKSKYVTVEVISNDTTATCVPCGFLGYPLRNYSGMQPNGSGGTADTTYKSIKAPKLKYNTELYDNIRTRRQYFGMSDLVGVDLDVLKYKGKSAYYVNPVSYSNGFHLDSRITLPFNTATSAAMSAATITVDGVSGYTFDTVSPNEVPANGSNIPIIGSEDEMVGTIYEDISYRKFTAYPYGGFDGWDIYRDTRTTSDDFKANKYKGSIRNGQGSNFTTNFDASALNLTGSCISSDYYAFLAGARQFANPAEYDINIIATPGIDYVNDGLLVDDIIDMVEEERADSIYVVTTPDKPQGASDSVDEMYTPSDAVGNLDDSNIDTSYACTYYPWVKYLDNENSRYINLPVTKDAVRNMALSDNQYQAWYAPAGTNRGNVECEKAHYVTKIGDEDTLYEGLINPVKTFATDGVKLWGNKTMYSLDTPLNRINVRRLMLRLRKLISIASIKIVFDPNDATVKNQFLSLVTPILNNIQSNRGISDYKISIDDSAEARDRHELPSKIWIKPIGALEYIDINFIITPEGAEFED